MVEPQSSKLMVRSARSHGATEQPRKLKTEIPAKTRPTLIVSDETQARFRGCSLMVKP